MTHCKSPIGRYGRSPDVCRAVLIALALLPAGCNRDEQQAAARLASVTGGVDDAGS